MLSWSCVRSSPVFATIVFWVNQGKLVPGEQPDMVIQKDLLSSLVQLKTSTTMLPLRNLAMQKVIVNV